MKVLHKDLREMGLANEFEFDVPIGRRSTLKAGGNSDCVFAPRSIESLIAFRQWNSEQSEPEEETILGGLSNVLIRDGGIRGVVIMLDKLRTEPKWGEVSVIPAGMRNAEAQHIAMQKGFAGLEVLAGIPGTLGGAVAMNAGAFQWEMSHILEGVEIIDSMGIRQWVKRSEIDMRYRDGGIKDGSIITKVSVRLEKKEAAEILRQQKFFKQQRRARIQIPSGVGTAGSTFKNPENGPKAWELIDEVGGRGLRLGHVKFSERHPNYIENGGESASETVENLINFVQEKVINETNIQIEKEIKTAGEAKNEQRK